jgi:hypothetical protein
VCLEERQGQEDGVIEVVESRGLQVVLLFRERQRGGLSGLTVPRQ